MSNQEVSTPLQWVTCVLEPLYEISTTTPHQIRKADTGRIIHEYVTKEGYLRCSLNGTKYLKHVIIARQFIDNPDNLPYVDHINHIRTDNRIENLRWCTHQQNTNQRSDQTFVDELPDEAIVVESYGDWEFEWLYYHNNTFYVYNGINYVIKPRFQTKSGSYCANMTDKSGTLRTIHYRKFKREYNLI